MDVMIVVGLYVLVTAPLLGITLLIHGLKSDYTGLFVTGLVLQLIPIGLAFFPLGFLGVAVLAYTLWGALRRNQRFKALGIDNLEVYKRWSLEYQANLVALAFAIEQKGVSLLFIEVASRRGFGLLWGLAPASVVLWAVVIALVVRERRTLPALTAE